MLRLAILAPLIILVGCSSEPTRVVQALPVDLSGHWEMDYSRSDNVNEKLRRTLREWQRQLEKRAAMDRGRAQGPTIPVGGSPKAFNAILASARLADMITESQVLEIEQSAGDIEIRRENTFALTCIFQDGEPEVVVDDLGSETCGWTRGELIFVIQLPNGLNIQHRLTISEQGDRLRVATTVDSEGSAPFTVNRLYFKFNPLPEDYNCEYTLSRGNVCQRGPT